jgi:DNA-binding SARP family transcriptional activator
LEPNTRIQLCGRLVAEVSGRRIEQELPGRQGRVLFAYLVANRAQPTARDQIADTLWPERVPSAVDSAVSALLSKLRRLVGPERLKGRGRLQLLLPEGSWIDLEAAAEALHRAEGAAARGEWEEAWGPARVAQHIAARTFLAGEEAPWIDEWRRILDDIYLHALELTAQASLGIGGGELDTAERAARTLVARAPYRESGFRFLMQALAARDNPAEGLRVYEELRVRLRDELGTTPSPTTQALHKQLLTA